MDPTSTINHDEATLSFYEEMVESAHDGILLVEGNIIINCNEAACKLYGLSRDELNGSHPGKLSTPLQPDGEDSSTKANRYMAAAVAGTPQKFLWRHIRRGHGSFIAEITLNPARSVETPGQGVRPRFVTILRDVTDEQATANALRESEVRFRDLFDKSPVALALTSGTSVTTVNRRWQTLFGYSHSQVENLNDWWCLAYPEEEYRLQSQQRWDQSLSQLTSHAGVIPSSEYRVQCSNGEFKHVLIGAARVGEETMVSFHDITEQHHVKTELKKLNNELENRVADRTSELQQTIEILQKTQQELVQSEKLASLGSLVAGIAHELNTPIGNAVMVSTSQQQLTSSLAQDFQQGLKRSTLEHFIASIEETSEVLSHNLARAAELITSFKQVAVDQSSYNRRTFNLNEVIHELRLTLSPSLRKAGVKLKEEIDPDIELDSYPGPLTQVLMNIVNNAIMHAFSGVESPTIMIESKLANEKAVILEITDNGTGISKHHLARIFDPFFTTKLGKGGSGLGLHIVYSLVSELLGGRIQVSNTSTSGSCFELTLPFVAPEQTATTDIK
jgi:PAS domain S-box-containing protein